MKIKEEWLGFGPLCLLLGIPGLFLFQPYPSYDELKVVKGVVTEYHWQPSGSWRSGGSKYIYVSTDTDFLKFGVSTGKNAIVVGAPIIVRIRGKEAWELEQNDRVIYTYEQTVSDADRINKWMKPTVVMSVLVGVFLTPLWVKNRRKNRSKIRSLF
jgi:hypothetical protein